MIPRKETETTFYQFIFYCDFFRYLSACCRTCFLSRETMMSRADIYKLYNIHDPAWYQTNSIYQYIKQMNSIYWYRVTLDSGTHINLPFGQDTCSFACLYSFLPVLSGDLNRLMKNILKRNLTISTMCWHL